MKNQLSIFTLSLIAVLSTFSQKLEVIEVETKLSKEAAKAKKSGALDPAGIYWNEDKSSIYQFYAYTPKKSDESLLEVVSIEEGGKVKGVEMLPNTAESLAKFNLQTLKAATETSQKELEGLDVAFIRNPKLAGFPTLFSGSLVDRYQKTKAGELWAGYKFEKEEEHELSDKFWSFISYPLDDEIIARNNYLLGDPNSLRGVFTGAGIRQYLPKNGKAYIGGLKATSGINIFISGILNVSDGTWDSKEEIDVGMKIGNSSTAPHFRYDDGSTIILLNSAEQYKLLHVNKKGEKISLNKLANPRSGGKHGAIPSASIQSAGGKVFALTATYESITGKGVGLSVSPIQDGTPSDNWTLNNDDLVRTLVLAPKQKVKAEKMKFLKLQTMQQLVNGDFLVNGYATYERASGIDRVFVGLQISASGVLKATYVLDAIEKDKEQRFDYSYGDILPVIRETEDGFFWIERAVLEGYEKGIHTSSSSYTAGNYRYSTVSAWRVDDTSALGQVVKVNTTNLSLSNVETVDGQIIGDEIDELSKSGHLVLFTGKGLSIFK